MEQNKKIAPHNEEQEKSSDNNTLLPANFKLIVDKQGYEDGVYKVSVDKEGKEKLRFVCSPLYIVATTCDEKGNNHGLLLNWEDSQKNKRQLCMSRKLLVTSANEIIGDLADQGLDIGSSTLLRELLNKANPDHHIENIGQAGWYKKCFILPNATIPNTENIVLREENTINKASESEALCRNGKRT